MGSNVLGYCTTKTSSVSEIGREPTPESSEYSPGLGIDSQVHPLSLCAHAGTCTSPSSPASVRVPASAPAIPCKERTLTLSLPSAAPRPASAIPCTETCPCPYHPLHRELALTLPSPASGPDPDPTILCTGTCPAPTPTPAPPLPRDPDTGDAGRHCLQQQQSLRPGPHQGDPSMGLSPTSLPKPLRLPSFSVSTPQRRLKESNTIKNSAPSIS